MSKRVIKVDLSPDGIDHAIAEVQRFKQDLLNAMTELLNTLGLRAYGAATLYLESNAKVFSSNLINSLKYTEAGGKKKAFVLRCDAVATSGGEPRHYAAYVEFGTGIYGGGHPEEDLVGWISNMSGKGDDGWAFQNATTGKWYTTKGQPSTPFMYNARMTVRNEVPKFTATIFAKL